MFRPALDILPHRHSPIDVSPMDVGWNVHRRFAPTLHVLSMGKMSSAGLNVHAVVSPHVHQTKRLWVELSSVGRNIHGPKRPYMGWTVHGAKSINHPEKATLQKHVIRHIDWYVFAQLTPSPSTLKSYTLECFSSAFNALTLFVGREEGHPACKNWLVR